MLDFDGLAEDDVPGRRAWKRISDHDRIKMIISVEFGLSGHFAGKIINSRSCNAARMIKEQEATKKKEAVALSLMSSKKRTKVIDL